MDTQKHQVPPRRPFGPNQIAWLDKNIHGFKAMREQAEAAQAHAERRRLELGLEFGCVESRKLA